MVDDNETSREILVHYLTSFGFQVRTAENAEQAFEAIENHGIEFVAMDWMMPGMNGIEATIHIKTKMGLEKVPKVILISAFAKDELVQKDGAEFAAGTNPGDPASVLRIVEIRLETGQVVLEWKSRSGKTYRLLRGDDLQDLKNNPVIIGPITATVVGYAPWFETETEAHDTTPPLDTGFSEYFKYIISLSADQRQ